MFDTVMCAYGMHLRSWKCTAGQFIESWNMVKTVISILSSSALVIVIDALSVSNNKTKGVNEMSRNTIFGEGEGTYS